MIGADREVGREPAVVGGAGLDAPPLAGLERALVGVGGVGEGPTGDDRLDVVGSRLVRERFDVDPAGERGLAIAGGIAG